MKKLYQSEWHGITFSSVHPISSRRLANADFYDAFYRALFLKYHNYDSLNPAWRRCKDEIADWISDSLPDGARVLSIGCGLGYIEQRLWYQHGKRIELHVQDYASQALKWLKQVLPGDRIHEVVTDNHQFDLIYLSAVDYSIPDAELTDFLSSLRRHLCNGGTLLIVSASYLDESAGTQAVAYFKDVARWILEAMGIRHRGQFWGWMRSRHDYQSVMRRAVTSSVEDGFLITPNQRTYWIKGMD